MIPPILLASSSPYRRQQLESLKLNFQWKSPSVDEEALKQSAKVDADDLPLFLAQQKAKSLVDNTNTFVIGCDQMAFLGDKILNKSKTKEDAINQLKVLQGREHRLCTAMAIHFNGEWKSYVDNTFLTMHSLTETEIINYVEKDQPLGCAGSYKWESLGITLFNEISSEDPSAIIGLPLLSLGRAFRDFGIKIL